MVQNKVIGKLLSLKLMVRAADAPTETAKFMGHGVCDNVNKSTNLPELTNSLEAITKGILDINKKMNINPEDLRGISIQMSKLENADGVKNKGIKKFMFQKQDAILPVINIKAAKEMENEKFDKNNLGTSLDNNITKNINTDTITINKINPNSIKSKPKSLNLGISKRRGRPLKHLASINKLNNSGQNRVIEGFFSSEKNNSHNFSLLAVSN